MFSSALKTSNLRKLLNSSKVMNASCELAWFWFGLSLLLRAVGADFTKTAHEFVLYEIMPHT